MKLNLINSTAVLLLLVIATTIKVSNQNLILRMRPFSQKVN